MPVGSAEGGGEGTQVARALFASTAGDDRVRQLIERDARPLEHCAKAAAVLSGVLDAAAGEDREKARSRR